MPAVNKFKPHLFIVPEDEADERIANGFQLHLEVAGEVQIMPAAGGWKKVINTILVEYVPILKSNGNAHVIGIIDCDNDSERIAKQLATFPADLRERIFVIGANANPEVFKNAVKMKFEQIGEKLAAECFSDQFELWNHEMLSYAAGEVVRAKNTLRTFLFPKF